MNCPNCRTELKINQYKGAHLHCCGTCEGFWFEGREFQQAMEKEDQFLRWADLELWKKDAYHQLKNRAEPCPSCSQYLFEMHYQGYDIHPWVCVDCHGVWVEKKELKKIIQYLEEQVDNKKVLDFIKFLGKEAMETLNHDSLQEQLKDFSVVLKLIGYRIVSRFPFLVRLSRDLPKP